MARLNKVEHARAGGRKTDMPTCGRCRVTVEAGQPYYWWATRSPGARSGTRHVRCIEHRPRPSEMQTSPYRAAAYSAQEALDDLTSTVTEGDFEALIQEVGNAAESVRDECEGPLNDGADNIESGFGHETYQSSEMRERAEAFGEWADELESAVSEIESQQSAYEEAREEHDECAEDAECGHEAAMSEAWEEALGAAQAASEACPE